MTDSTQAARDVLLLANLGTPSAPTASAVSRYLAEFLSDPRVVQLPRLFWLPLLRLVVLPLRSRKVSHNYAAVWMDGGSPLEVHTRRLAAAVQEQMPGVHVEHVMRYGEPALTRRLRELRGQGARVLVLPLYPQYSTTTTASVGDVVARELPDARMVDDYHVDPAWVQAVAGSIRTHWERHGRGDRLLFSFHGIPQRLVDQGDPYERQCLAGARAIATALELPDDAWQATFQSRFGGGKWLSPATDATVRALPAEGVKRIDVACPGFAADCLETLEEIAMQNAGFFREAGGDELSYIPCLNDDPAHARAIAGIATREFDAWR
ncbi:ferrochelatase [Luteimonas terricola]|uniref:Ferrochelatase n=1 Tax=Luteimonas terricola TaxID=645597 RepID=A0ABQ2E4V4_9GAMM|nr:ferrochelatase [Luteimonas terricola]GGJ96031.1 ferrochelatase [Luteimonas terricola]